MKIPALNLPKAIFTTARAALKVSRRVKLVVRDSNQIFRAQKSTRLVTATYPTEVELINDALCLNGIYLDQTIVSIHSRGGEESKIIFEKVIRKLIGRLRHYGDLSAHSHLENHGDRLRILRFIEEWKGAKNREIIYPLCGFDCFSVLTHRRITGIDWMIDIPVAPSEPSFFKGKLISGAERERRSHAFAERLESIYERIAQLKIRYRGVAGDALDENFLTGLNEDHPTPRITFFKGISRWIEQYYHFPGEKTGSGKMILPHNLKSTDETAVWMADRYTRPGDHLVIWDTDSSLIESVLKTKRFKRMDLPFLSTREREILRGTGQTNEVWVSPSQKFRPPPHHGLILHFIDKFEILERIVY